ncbi:hypothetical protein PPERSA_06583 [Pseudocohnilembus persalinus]|uniref:Uncharacterized protein n=1 Tax=Pseudocohnilembus persalinus TaxID=266149 RepID=A0A0V0QSR3_PSEPJ|nr:hypothetical protein PPERSA_06583 [Pseudocohnilembus persalinus]|eukprot:KRX04949.1 hypothetical protein PPERSA_06583 [Pseudocohnilembus persalinus]
MEQFNFNDLPDTEDNDQQYQQQPNQNQVDINNTLQAQGNGNVNSLQADDFFNENNQDSVQNGDLFEQQNLDQAQQREQEYIELDKFEQSTAYQQIEQEIQNGQNEIQNTTLNTNKTKKISDLINCYRFFVEGKVPNDFKNDKRRQRYYYRRHTDFKKYRQICQEKNQEMTEDGFLRFKDINQRKNMGTSLSVEKEHQIEDFLRSYVEKNQKFKKLNDMANAIVQNCGLKFKSLNEKNRAKKRFSQKFVDFYEPIKSSKLRKSEQQINSQQEQTSSEQQANQHQQQQQNNQAQKQQQQYEQNYNDQYYQQYEENKVEEQLFDHQQYQNNLDKQEEELNYFDDNDNFQIGSETNLQNSQTYVFSDNQLEKQSSFLNGDISLNYNNSFNLNTNSQQQETLYNNNNFNNNINNNLFQEHNNNNENFQEHQQEHQQYKFGEIKENQNEEDTYKINNDLESLQLSGKIESFKLN